VEGVGAFASAAGSGGKGAAAGASSSVVGVGAFASAGGKGADGSASSDGDAGPDSAKAGEATLIKTSKTKSALTCRMGFSLNHYLRTGARYGRGAFLVNALAESFSFPSFPEGFAQKRNYKL
jgi:hypothetical protein